MRCFVKVPLLRRRGNAEGMGWLFFGNCVLITFEDQRTTTPVVFDAFPSFAGGGALISYHLSLHQLHLRV